MTERRRVVVTGLGAVSPLGNDACSTWQAMLAGRSGVARITLFDPEPFAIQIAGEEAIRKAVEEAMQSYQRPSGMIRLNNEFRVVVSVPK